MHSHDTIEKTEGWRNNWFVKNVLAEIPIIGAFFHTENIPYALHHAGKSTAMLVGGSVGMMLDILKTESTDNMGVSMTKGTVNMAVGMMAGNVVYNTIFSLGSSTYKWCQFQSSETSSLESSTETDPLIDNQEKRLITNNTL